MDELLPGWRSEAPLDAEVTHEDVYFLTEKGEHRLPLTPPPLQDHGNYVISINRFVKWLGEKVEQAGITVFTGFAGSELLVEGDHVIGVRTDDKGVDKHGQKKSNFEPGYDVKSKITVLAEGPRGSLTKQLVAKYDLQKGPNPQVYGIGVKELWDPIGRIKKGQVIYAMGWPLTMKEYGGGWIYGSKDNMVSLGYVPASTIRTRVSIPARAAGIQTASADRRLVARRQDDSLRRQNISLWRMVSMPPLAGNGWMIVGDSASFLNSQRLKGIHLAIKSGMLAAETAFDALLHNNFSAAQLRHYKESVDASWIKDELWEVRNFHQAFDKGLVSGLFHTALQQITGGRGLHENYPAHAGHTRMTHLDQLPADGGNRAHLLGKAKGDGKLTFDKLTDLYHSGTKHEEDQPSHLIIHDTNICNTRCVTEFGNPCQNFCPANVYEMEEDASAPKRQSDPPESFELRALQDLRHHGPLRDHHLGAARGRRRAELRRNVVAPSCPPLIMFCACPFVGSADFPNNSSGRHEVDFVRVAQFDFGHVPLPALS